MAKRSKTHRFFGVETSFLLSHGGFDRVPRFVLLEHNHPFLHWDFMLEHGGVLRTWRLHEFPNSGAHVEAERLADHRLAYLDYEGPVSGGRGEVVRRDRGRYETIEAGPGSLLVRLAGRQLRGCARIVGDVSGGRALFYFESD